MNSGQKIALGSVVATLGSVAILLSTTLMPSVSVSLVPVGLLFLVGVSAGLGATLAVFGLRERWRQT